MSDDPTSPAAKAEQLLREAHLLRMRGQFAGAEERCRQALEVAPDDAAGQEMLADLLVEKGNLEEARDLYAGVLAAQPGRASAETSLARITLELAERQQERDMAQAVFTGAGRLSHRERKRHLSLSLMMALVGAGQLYNGEYVKGAIVAVVSWAGLFLGGMDLARLLFSLMGAKPHEPITDWRAILGFVGLFTWIYGLIDAPVRARKLSEEGRGGGDFF
jgi:tetratricopeptide (TPR) repeat protein